MVVELPEDYVFKLANSKVATLQHLLPMVQAEIDWPDIKEKVVLNGVRGEVPILHANEKKPLLQPVPKGKINLGYLLHHDKELKKGDKVTVLGMEFTVHELHSPRGPHTRDDLSAWINLTEAQELLQRKGSINAILALECNCATQDRLTEIRTEVQKILPKTKVYEFTDIATVRADMRNKDKENAKKNLAQKKAHAAAEFAAFRTTRDQLGQQLLDFAALVIPLVVLACIVWLGVMSLNNVRERHGEIGILRALGLRSGSIFSLFVGRAVIVGLIGAVLGCGLGILTAGIWGETAQAGSRDLFEPWLLLTALLAAPALCAVVGWLAALAAARQDPAVVLQQA
jgi:ABC-type lipoprotein release transport system permease subunit